MEWGIYAGQGTLFLALLSYVFYRSATVFFLLLPLALAYPVFKKTELKKKRLDKLRLQFKEAILILSSSLNAGYSVENSFSATAAELERVYGRDAMIAEELRLMVRKIKMNRPVEEVMMDFAARSGLDDVRNFAEVFVAAHKSGGELMKIISQTAEIISEKIRIQEEITTMTAARRMEQKVMNAIPVMIVIYIEMSSPGFFEVLYKTLTGRAIMTVCLAVYLLAYWMAGKLLEIEV